MTGIYGAAKVCPFEEPNCDLSIQGLTLEPGISAVIDNPTDYTWDELVYYWQEWRTASGSRMRSQFLDYLELSNQAAKSNGGLEDASELWLSSYLKDDVDFRTDLEDLWQQIKPFYEKLQEISCIQITAAPSTPVQRVHYFAYATEIIITQDVQSK